MFDGGFSATSLAVFTALAPAGAVAYACLAASLLARRNTPIEQRERVMRLLLLPLAVAWAGFIASATHLGTPANALHAVNGIGRSPLSNEVVSVVAFLFFSGMAWMYSFSQRLRPKAMNSLLAAAIAASALMLFHMSFAYSIATVPTWDTWLTPANLWAASLLSGPALAALALQASRCPLGRWPYALLLISAVALACGTGLLAAHAAFLATVSNNVANAVSLVPNYGWLIASHTVLAACGLGFQLYGMRLPSSHARGLVFSSVGCTVVVIAALLARFPFYDAYLSVGF